MMSGDERFKKFKPGQIRYDLVLPGTYEPPEGAYAPGATYIV